MHGMNQLMLVEDRVIDDSNSTLDWGRAPGIAAACIGHALRIQPIVGRVQQFFRRDPQTLGDGDHPSLAIFDRLLANRLVRGIRKNLALDLHGWQVLALAADQPCRAERHGGPAQDLKGKPRHA